MLTKRELEVLELRHLGHTQTEIAEKLRITQAAVSNFERNTKRKIRDAEETLQAARKYGGEPQ